MYVLCVTGLDDKSALVQATRAGTSPAHGPLIAAATGARHGSRRVRRVLLRGAAIQAQPGESTPWRRTEAGHALLEVGGLETLASLASQSAPAETALRTGAAPLSLSAANTQTGGARQDADERERNEEAHRLDRRRGTAAVVVLGGGGSPSPRARTTRKEPDTAITGDALQQASDAALAHLGEGEVTDTEVGDEEGHYEVEVTLDDGSEVDVHLDEDFTVISEEREEGSDGD